MEFMIILDDLKVFYYKARFEDLKIIKGRVWAQRENMNGRS